MQHSSGRRRQGKGHSTEGDLEQSSYKNRPRLLDQVRGALQSRHYSKRTVDAYVHWIRRYIRFHNKRHPKDMAEADINAFLIHLAVEAKVSVSTQNQALSALLFLYRHVLKQELDELGDIVRARKPRRLPVVGAKGGHSGGANGRLDEAGHVPHISPLVRNAFAGRRLRHTYDTGIARAQRRTHDDDLHPRFGLPSRYVAGQRGIFDEKDKIGRAHV